MAKRRGINPKIVAKWKKRTAIKDLPTGPEDAHSTVLTAFRKHTLLPLDDCFYALQTTLLHMTRSSLLAACDEHGIEHHLTKVKRPWTNGQVE